MGKITCKTPHQQMDAEKFGSGFIGKIAVIANAVNRAEGGGHDPCLSHKIPSAHQQHVFVSKNDRFKSSL